MADEETGDSDKSTATSPLQRHEDVGGSTHVLSETTDTEEWLQWIQFDDEEIPVASGSGPAQASNIPTGMSPEREANQHSSIAHQVQQYSNCNVSQNPSFHPFVLDSCQVSPSLGPIAPVSPVPPQAQTAASLPSLPPTVDFLQTLSQTSAPFKPPIGHQVQQYSNWNVSENPSFDPFILESSQVSPSLGPIPPVSPDLPQAQTHKREANRHSSIAHQFQQVHPSFDPFILESSQVSLSLGPIPQVSPFPPQPQTAASHPSLPLTVDFLQTLSETSAPFQSPIQTASPVSHFAKEIPPVPMLPDQAISGSRRSGLAQASNASAGPFLKRYGTQPPPTSVREIRSTIDLSVPRSAQPAPPLLAYTMQTAPGQPGAQTADFISSISGYVDLSQTLYPTNAPPPSPAQTGRRGSRLPTATPPLRISPDLNRIRSTSETMCRICRMDIALHPMVSTLPCGHRFHGMCLNFTSAAKRLRRSGLHPPCPVCRRTIR